MTESVAHDAASCPLLERIIRTETKQNMQMPDDFAEQWGRQKELVEQIHHCIFENGFETRLRKVESRLYWMTGAAAGAGALISLAFSLWKALH